MLAYIIANVGIIAVLGLAARFLRQKGGSCGREGQAREEGAIRRGDIVIIARHRGDRGRHQHRRRQRLVPPQHLDGAPWAEPSSRAPSCGAYVLAAWLVRKPGAALFVGVIESLGGDPPRQTRRASAPSAGASPRALGPGGRAPRLRLHALRRPARSPRRSGRFPVRNPLVLHPLRLGSRDRQGRLARHADQPRLGRHPERASLGYYLSRAHRPHEAHPLGPVEGACRIISR